MNKRELNNACSVRGYQRVGMGRPRYVLHIDSHAVPALGPWACLHGEHVSSVRAGYVIINAIRAAVLAGVK